MAKRIKRPFLVARPPSGRRFHLLIKPVWPIQTFVHTFCGLDMVREAAVQLPAKDAGPQYMAHSRRICAHCKRLVRHAGAMRVGDL